MSQYSEALERAWELWDGDPEKARQLAEEITPEALDPGDRGILLWLKGVMEMEKGEASAAIALLWESSALLGSVYIEGKSPDDGRVWANMLERAGSELQDADENASAWEFYHKALQLNQELAGKRTIEDVVSEQEDLVSSFVSVSSALENDEAALPWCKALIKHLEGRLDDQSDRDDWVTLSFYTGVAAKGRQAVGDVEGELAWRRKEVGLDRKLGLNPCDYQGSDFFTGSLFALGHRLETVARFGDAIPVYQELVEAHRRRLLDGRDLLAGALSYTARMLRKLGREEELAGLLPELLDLSRGVAEERGTEDDLINHWENLDEAAGCRRRMGDIRLAAENYREAIAVISPVASKKNILLESWVNLAECLSELGEQEDSLAAYQEAIALDRFFVGDDRLPGDLWNLAVHCLAAAELHEEIGRHDEADVLYAEYLRLFREIYEGDGGPDDAWDLAVALKNRAKFLLAAGRAEQAVQLALEAVPHGIASRPSRETDEDWDYYRSLFLTLAEVFSAAGLDKESEACAQEAAYVPPEG